MKDTSKGRSMELRDIIVIISLLRYLVVICDTIKERRLLCFNIKCELQNTMRLSTQLVRLI